MVGFRASRAHRDDLTTSKVSKIYAWRMEVRSVNQVIRTPQLSSSIRTHQWMQIYASGLTIWASIKSFSAYDSRLSHCESVQAAFQDPQLRPFFGWQILDDLGQIRDFWVAPMFAHHTRFIAWCPVIIHLIAMPLAAHNVWFKPSNLVREDVTHGEQTVAFPNDSSLCRELGMGQNPGTVPWTPK